MKVKGIKLVLIANTYWYLYNFRSSLIQKMLDLRYEIHLLAAPDNYEDQFTKHKDLHIHHLQNLERPSTNIIQEIRSIKEISRILDAIKPQLVLSHTVKPNIYCNLFRHKDVIKIGFITGLGSPFIQDGFLKKLLVRLYKRVLKNMNITYCENQEDLEFLQKIQPASTIRYIAGTGVNTDFYRQEKSLSTEPFTFVFSGRLIRDKGIMELLTAFKRVRDENTRLIIMGDLDRQNPSALIASEIALLNESGAEIYSHQKDVRPHINSSTVFVLPSYREGLSRSLLEAMSMSRPIITTKVPGCQELIEEGQNGFLVPAQNIEALTDVMRHSKTLSEATLIDMGNRSRQIILEKYHEEKIHDEIISSIREVLTIEAQHSTYNS